MSRRAALAPFLVIAVTAACAAIVACNEGGGVAGPSNTPHGSRCLMDTDCMGGYECSKGKGDIHGECVPKTMGGVGAGGGASGSGGGGGSAKPAGSGGSGGAGGAGGAATAPSGKPADPPKGGGHNQTAEPLPPPKPPKDAKPATDSTFSP